HHAANLYTVDRATWMYRSGTASGSARGLVQRGAQLPRVDAHVHHAWLGAAQCRIERRPQLVPALHAPAARPERLGQAGEVGGAEVGADPAAAILFALVGAHVTEALVV